MNLRNNKKKIFMYLAGTAAIPAVIFLAMHIIKGLSRVTTDDAYVDGRFYTIAARSVVR